MGIFKDNYRFYLELGLIPFPAQKNGKSPIVKWRNINPTAEDYLIWEKNFPNANIWVLLGDYVVIDPDGIEAEKFVESLNLPNCPISNSGNKSIHRWFKSANGIRARRVSIGKNGDFLEIRTGKMGMLVPPSIHPRTGNPYRWQEGFSPNDLPFPEIPLHIIEEIEGLDKEPSPNAETQKDFPSSLDVKRYLDAYGICYQIKQLDRRRILYAFARCPFADEHTTQDKEGDSGIIEGPDGKLGFHCFHNHCNTKTWQDVRNAISGHDSIKKFFINNSQQQDSLNKKSTRYEEAVLSISELKNKTFPEKRKILSPWLSEQSLVMISGWRGIGKSWFTMGLLHAIITGAKFGPWETVTPVNCLYVDGEMAIQDVQARFNLLDLSSPNEIKAELFIINDYYANSQGLLKSNLLNPEFRNWLKKFCKDRKIGLVALDNLSSLCPGIDENSKKEWDEINQWLIDLRFNEISVIFLHHTNKEGGQRGTSAHEDNVDISILLERPSNYSIDDGARFVVKFTKKRLRQSELALVKNIEFQLVEQNNRLIWVFGSDQKNKWDVLRLLSEGYSQKDISKQLNISESQVSKIKKSLVEEKYLHNNGALTQLGISILTTSV